MMNGLLKLMPLLSDEPCIIDNYFNAQELLNIQSFLKNHEKDFSCGKVISPFDGPIYNFDVKRNLVFFDSKIELDDIYTKIKMTTLEHIKNYFKSSSQNLENEFSKLNFHRGHFSQYSHGYYDYHLDKTQTGLTIVVPLFFGNRIFSGGDFLYKIENREEKIPFKQNQLIIFKSKTPHKISLASPVDKEFFSARFSLQIWPTFEEEAQSEISSKDEIEYNKNRVLLIQKLMKFQSDGLSSEDVEFLEKYIQINFKGVFNYIYFSLFNEFPDAKLSLSTENKSQIICYEYKKMKLFYKIKQTTINYFLQLENKTINLDIKDSSEIILSKAKHEN